MFDQIADLQGRIAIPLYAAGKFNLIDGKYTSFAEPLANHETKTSLTLSSKNDTIRTQTLYTVNDVQEITNYSIDLSSLTFPTDLNDIRGNRTFDSNMNFNFKKSFTPELGKKYKIIVDFLTTSRNITNSGGNVDWAYHNLFYDESSKVYGFRHYNSNYYERGVSAGAQQSGEYFNWKALKPGMEQAPGMVDPCLYVYPKGRWRMPTANEFNTISNIPSSSSTMPRKLNGRSADPVRYINVVLAPGDYSPYDNYTNGFPLLLLGYRGTGSNVISGYNTSTIGQSSLYYWTSDEVDSGNSTYFYMANLSNIGTAMTARTATARKTNGMNIRCVLDRNYVYVPDIR